MRKTRIIVAIIMVLIMSLWAFVASAEANAVQVEPVTIDLSDLLQAVIAVVAVLITRKLIPWLKSKLSTEQQIGLSVMARTLVFAAEQIYGAGHGKEKLEYVKTELEARGYTFDAATVEAEVRQLTMEMMGALTAPAKSGVTLTDKTVTVITPQMTVQEDE